VRAKDGRGLLVVLFGCAADARYDAGLNDRLAILGYEDGSPSRVWQTRDLHC